MKRFKAVSRVIASLVLLLAAVACSYDSALAQEKTYQRDFPVSLSEAQAAVRSIVPASRGRLPTLAGFAQQTDQPLERYERAYYDCTFQVFPSPSGGSTIRAVARVTSWYNDPDPTHSGYKVLISNGRLEMDLLDRLEQQLTPSAPMPTASAVGGGWITGASSHGFDRAIPGARASVSSAGGFSSAILAPQHVAPDAAISLPPGSTLESLKAAREVEEKKSRELSAYVTNLEEIQRNQSRPNDLIAIKRAKTPIFAKPSETAQLLMHADLQDEFQVLGVDGAWVHVQISGASRGWIRRAQLEMPVGFSQATAAPGETGATDAGFKVIKEEASSFSGNWAPLKGKAVRVEWVEPANSAASTSPKEKLAFARSVFLNAYQKLDSSQPLTEGIVVVFDSADGGQIAATLSTVKGLASRTISDAGFWRQCSLDPPQSFLGEVHP
jgi:hypothetical protein